MQTTADSAEALWDVMRLGDAAMGRHFEAHALITADRKWWPEVRRVLATLRKLGLRCEWREGRGWFRRDFFVRCDEAALVDLHQLGDQMRKDWLRR